MVSVIIPCYNIGQDGLKVLRGLDVQDFGHPFEVIVVDDQSDDDTFRVVTSFAPLHYELRAYCLPQKGGPGAARNLALEVAKGDLIIFIGDDTVPARSFIRHHVEIHARKSCSRVAVLGHVEWPSDFPVNTLMRHVTGVGAQQFSYYYLKPGEEYDYRHFYTSNVSLERSLLEKEKRWFRREIFPFDDVELSYRLSKHGLKIIYYPEPLVEHYHYHNVWTFSKRQWNAGFSAWRLIKCHPATATLITRPATWTRKVVRGYARIRSLGLAINAPAYEQAVLRFASFYEWMNTPLLDFLYLHLLEYFYIKGLIDGLLGAQTAKQNLYQALQASVLFPAVDHFVSQARTSMIPLPQGYENMLRLASVKQEK